MMSSKDDKVISLKDHAEKKAELDVKVAAMAVYQRGKIAEGSLKWDDALEHFTRAVNLDPESETYASAKEAIESKLNN
mgnify:CR=1 FL=1